MSSEVDNKSCGWEIGKLWIEQKNYQNYVEKKKKRM